jgi:hypothetical protein
MKGLTLTLLAVFMVTIISAQEVQPQVLNSTQVGKLDLSGKWIGKRNQYSWDKKSFIETFQYEFDLKQEGNVITGTSTIINSNGDYADMMLEGVIIGNKFHFREYQIKSAIRPEGRVWCFKIGELNIVKVGDNIKFSGSTPSYMEGTNYPCSGGETDITKVDNSANLEALVSTSTTGTKDPLNMTFNTYPNPFVDNANISYTLTNDSRVKLEVYDMTGKLVTTIFDGTEKAGSYNFNFNAKSFASKSGVYIVTMIMNGETYSNTMIQMR